MKVKQTVKKKCVKIEMRRQVWKWNAKRDHQVISWPSVRTIYVTNWFVTLAGTSRHRWAKRSDSSIFIWMILQNKDKRPIWNDRAQKNWKGFDFDLATSKIFREANRKRVRIRQTMRPNDVVLVNTVVASFMPGSIVGMGLKIELQKTSK